MDALIIVLLVAVVAFGGVIVWLVAQGQRRPAADADAQRQEQQAQRLEQQLLTMKTELAQAVGASQQTVLQQVNSVDAKLNQRLDAVQSTVGQGLSAVQTDLNKTLTSQQETVGKIEGQLGELSQSTQQMLEVGRNISSLQDILRPPKLRGGFGELLLERLLAEILPARNYSTQHRFANGSQVDAVIHLGNGLVPVDSKFPLEAFNRMQKAESDEDRTAQRKDFVRAVRGHIDAVAKYILPDEGSFPFALMYIPAENVYYEVIVKDDLGDAHANLCAYAMERRVVPVSPSSFYAYLQAILLGLRGLQVEERAHEIIRHLEQLSGEFARVKKEFGTLGSHIKNASDRYSDIDRVVTKFGDRLQMTLQAPVQAPLPNSLAAPAPLAEPALTNGSDES
jgi:DNA recombination protein RmuC